MFTAAFLVWLFAWLKRVLAGRVRESVTGRVASKTLTVAGVAADVYPCVRACAYVYYMAGMGLVRSQVGEGAFMPSMRGVSQQQVERVVRQELRLRGGEFVGNTDDVVERLTQNLSTVVAENERLAVRDAAGVDAGRVAGSERYAAKHGNPVGRLVVAQERDQWWRDERHRSPELDQVVIQVQEMWVAEFGDVPAVPVEDMEAFRDWVEPLRQQAIDKARLRRERELVELARMAEREAQEEAELERADVVQVRKAVVEAEIYLGLRDKDGNWRKPGTVSSLPRTPQGHVMAGGWARVAVGPYTCGFCLLMCARGPIYHKESVTATPRRRKKGLADMIGAYGDAAYHPHCDCIGVAVGADGRYAGDRVSEGAAALYQHWRDNVPAEEGGWFLGAKPGVFDSWVRHNRGLAERFVPSAHNDLDVRRLVKQLEDSPRVRAFRERRKSAG